MRQCKLIGLCGSRRDQSGLGLDVWLPVVGEIPTDIQVLADKREVARLGKGVGTPDPAPHGPFLT